MVRFEIRGFRDSANGVEPDEVAEALRAELDAGYPQLWREVAA